MVGVIRIRISNPVRRLSKTRLTNLRRYSGRSTTAVSPSIRSRPAIVLVNKNIILRRRSPSSCSGPPEREKRVR